MILALEINGEDKIAQESLLKYYINYLDFSIHEIPAGFSRWVIEVENPELELKDDMIEEVELIMGFVIKVILAHY